MNALTIIEQRLTSQEVTNRLTTALGLKAGDENAQQEAFRYASSVLAEIRKTAGDPKRDLTVCSPDSICQAMIDAAQFKIAIDGRQQAHIVKFGNTAQLQIGFRGYIAKIAEKYQDADFTAEAIFEGDTLAMSDDGGFQSYKLTRKDVFASGWDKLQGVLVRISYSKGGERFQKITAVSKSDLDKIRKVAKTDYIWAQWPIEKAKAAAIKRASKIQFADVMGLQELARYDNELNYDLSKQEAAPVRKSIVDNINAGIEVIEGTAEEADPLLIAARRAAELGTLSYTEHIATLTEEQKAVIRPHNREFSYTARQADLDAEKGETEDDTTQA
jgi:recombinational DNA repair protein RecT